MEDRTLGRPIDILMVEDNPADSALFLELLNESEARTNVKVIETGREALGYLEEVSRTARRPDIVILDLKLPGMSGHEVLNRMKENPDTETIPVIVFSSSSAETGIDRAYRERACCYINKPTTLERMEDTVEAIETFWFKTVQLPPKPAG